MKSKKINKDVLDFACQRNYEVCIAIIPSYGVVVADNKVFFNDYPAFVYEEEGILAILVKSKTGVEKFKDFYQVAYNKLHSKSIARLKSKLSTPESRAKRYFVQISNIRLSEFPRLITIADDFDEFLKNKAKIHRDYKGYIRDSVKNQAWDNKDVKVNTSCGYEEIPESAFERVFKYIEITNLSQKELAKALQTKDSYNSFKECLDDLSI